MLPVVAYSLDEGHRIKTVNIENEIIRMLCMYTIYMENIGWEIVDVKCDDHAGACRYSGSENMPIVRSGKVKLGISGS